MADGGGPLLHGERAAAHFNAMPCTSPPCPMHPNTHKLLLILFVIVTALLGLGAVLDPATLPAKYAGAAAIATGALAFLKGLIVRVGDALDDGKLNGSFQPEPEADKSVRAPLKPWDHVNFFWVLALVLPCLLGSCADFWQRPGVKSFALTTAEGALVVANMQLDVALADWMASKEDSVAAQIAKGLAVQAKEAALREARRALADERAKLDKQPVNAAPAPAPTPTATATTRVLEGAWWEREGGIFTR